jgi:TctA family transporter
MELLNHLAFGFSVAFSLQNIAYCFIGAVRETAIEGVAPPEAANNAAAHASFMPALTLGIPGSPSSGANPHRSSSVTCSHR